MILAFEGCEGSGKGTQIKLLEQALTTLGFDILCIVEPGGTPTGQAIREVLLHKSELAILGLTEAFLFSASRAQQVNEVVKPARKAGKIILADRSFYSTFAYQGFGRQTDLKVIKKLTNLAVGRTKPNHVFLLDIDPQVGIARKRAQNEFNRLDAEDISFHLRVQSGYLTMARENPRMWKVIDANRPIDQIHEEILAIVLNLIG